MPVEMKMTARTSRIAMVVTSFPKLSETFIVNKFLGLAGRGWDVHVVCTRSVRREWENVRSPLLRGLRRRVHVRWRHEPRWWALLLIPFQLARCLAANPRGTARYLRRGWQAWRWDVLRRLYLDAELVILGPDVVHFEFGPLAEGRTYLGDLLESNVVISFRGYDLNYVGLDNPHYYNDMWRDADVLHLLGEDLWRRATRRGCPPDKPHWLIPPAIDTDTFDGERAPHAEVTGTAARPLRLVSVGRLEWKKGYEYALEAVRGLVDQDVRVEYRIVGGGDFLEPLAFARHELGLADIVHFVGPQPREQVLAQMRWADVFLHPAVSEGFCNAVLEAQAMRLPVVCSDADGLRENVVCGETGYVAPRRDPVALADRLVQLAQHPALRQSMGDRGRQRVQERFQLPAQIDAFERMYCSVATSEARGG